MRTLTLDVAALEVETFTTRYTPWLASAASDESDCDACQPPQIPPLPDTAICQVTITCDGDDRAGTDA